MKLTKKVISIIVRTFKATDYLKDFVKYEVIKNEKISFSYEYPYPVVISVWLITDDLTNSRANGTATYLQMKYLVKAISSIEEKLEEQETLKESKQ